MAPRVNLFPALLPLVLLAGCGGGEDVQGCAALRKGAPDKALEHCNRAIGSRMVWSKEKAQVRIDRGAILAERRDWDGAINDFSRALDSGRLQQGNQVIALHGRGTARIQKGDLAAGMADLDQALQLDPLHADAFANRALAWRMRGEHDRAIADADAALKVYTKHARALVQRGASLLLNGERDMALADLNEALRLEPGLQAARSIRGVLWHVRGEWDRALADFDEAVRLDPRDAGTLRNRAAVHTAKRDLDRALADLDAALKLEPGSVEALLRRAAIRGERGDLDRTIADAARVIELNPKAADGYNLRGWVHLQRRQFDAAIADFDRALALNARHLPALTNRLAAWSATKDYARALADLEALAQLAPAGADHRSIGMLRFVLGRYAESADALGRALQARAGDHYAALWRYLAQARAGEEPAARAGLAQATQSLGGRWPAAVVNLYLGKGSEAAMLAAANAANVANDADPKTRANRLCEANFYAGQAKLLRKQEAQALPLLRAAEKDCPRHLAEYDGAVAELKRLGG